MNEIFKKFNVFDYFSHLVPGTIVVLALLHYFLCKDQASMSNLFGCLYDKLAEHNTIAFWTFFLVASHCMGLVNNVISDLVWYGFRNNSMLIFLSKRKIYNDESNNTESCSSCCLMGCIIPISLCIASIFIAKVSTYPIRSSLIIFAILAGFGHCCSFAKGIVDDYYKAYERVKTLYPSNNISNLEAQIAFLRNSIIPLIILVLQSSNTDRDLLQFAPFIAFAAFFLHQQKLYFHVYELCRIIDLKGMKLKLLVLAKIKAGDDKTNVCNSFSQILDNKNCTEMCSGDLDGKKVGVVSFTDISNASFDTLKKKIEIYKDAKALVVTCQEEKVDLYKQIKKYAEKNSFELKEASFDEIESKIREFFNK